MFLASLAVALLFGAYACHAMSPMSMAAAQEQQNWMLMLLRSIPG